MPSKKTIITRESIAKKTIGTPTPKTPIKKKKRTKKTKINVSHKPKEHDESKKKDDSKKVTNRHRRKPGERATIEMLSSQTNLHTSRTIVERNLKFCRRIYNCARNIKPNVRIGDKAKKLIQQSEVDFVSELISRATKIACCNSNGKKIVRLNAMHILEALEMDPALLCRIAPHHHMNVSC